MQHGLPVAVELTEPFFARDRRDRPTVVSGELPCALGRRFTAFQKMHGKATETQVLVGADWIADVSIGGVAFLVSEAVNRHRQKRHGSLEIIIDMRSGSPVDVELPLAESLRASLMARESARPISHHLEALLDRLRIVTAFIEFAALQENLWMQALYRSSILQWLIASSSWSISDSRCITAPPVFSARSALAVRSLPARIHRSSARLTSCLDASSFAMSRASLAIPCGRWTSRALRGILRKPP